MRLRVKKFMDHEVRKYWNSLFQLDPRAKARRVKACALKAQADKPWKKTIRYTISGVVGWKPKDSGYQSTPTPFKMTVYANYIVGATGNLFLYQVYVYGEQDTLLRVLDLTKAGISFTEIAKMMGYQTALKTGVEPDGEYVQLGRDEILALIRNGDIEVAEDELQP